MKVVLYADDDPAYLRLVEEAFEEAGRGSQIYTVTDGAEALAFLRQDGDYADAPVPDLVLLDWQLPRASGSEVLDALQDELGNHPPIVVFTNSDSGADITQAYDLGANAYVLKPAAFDDLVSLMDSIATFWLGNKN